MTAEEKRQDQKKEAWIKNVIGKLYYTREDAEKAWWRIKASKIEELVRNDVKEILNRDSTGV